jgi:hypothetical protein
VGSPAHQRPHGAPRRRIEAIGAGLPLLTPAQRAAAPWPSLRSGRRRCGVG